MVFAPLQREVSAVFSSEIFVLFGVLLETVETPPPDLMRRRFVPSMLGKLILPFGGGGIVAIIL